MTTRKKITTVLGWIFGNLIYFITFMVPKKKNLWVFGAWFGEKYSDNSKFLFEYVCVNHPEIRAVWLSNNAKALALIKAKGFETCSSYGLKGTWLSMRAELGVVSVWTSDINYFAISNMKLVQLWHGTPLKKIGYDDNTSVEFKSTLQKYFYKLFPYLGRDFSRAMITTPSPHVRDLFVRAFRASENNVKITGYPRNDVFFMRNIEDFPIKKKIMKFKKANKIGIYMPTHRQKGKKNMSSLLSGGLINEVNSKLNALGVILLIKYHHYQLQNSNEDWTSYSNITVLTDDDINHDVYPILTLTDFLITDYSSILFDYLLTDKPLIFAPFDIEDYLRNDREFYYDYNDITPGPKASNWSEVVDHIENLMIKPDQYKQERAIIRNKFNKYADNKNSERVFNEIIKLC